MNIFVVELATRNIEQTSNSNEITIEDNIGESVHIHFPAARLEMTISDFETFASQLYEAEEMMRNGNC